MTSASEGSCSWIANTATWVIPTTTFSIDCTRLACSVSPKISSVNFVTYFGSVLVRRNSQHAKGMACPPHEGFRYHCSSALILYSNFRKDLRGCIRVPPSPDCPRPTGTASRLIRARSSPDDRKAECLAHHDAMVSVTTLRILHTAGNSVCRRRPCS